MIIKAVMENLNDAYEVIKDAKEMFKRRGSSQWQDLDGYPSIETLKKDIELGNLYIKVLAGQVIGVIVISGYEATYEVIYEGNWLNDEKYNTVHRIAVKKEFLGQGIGLELMKFSEQKSIEDGIYNIKIDTMENNFEMIHLVNKLGYSKCGIIYLARDKVIDKKRVAFQKVLK